MRIDYSAVACCKELGLSDHLKACFGADPTAVWAAGQTAVCKPMGCSTAGANKAGSCLEFFGWIQLACLKDLDGGFS